MADTKVEISRKDAGRVISTPNNEYSQLYHDLSTGRNITTHSMIKTMRTCPKQAYYKYVLRLKPQMLGRPLRFGTWMHALFEVHYRGEDWRIRHKELTHAYAKLFDEEKERVGDLPRECAKMMTSYLWHYKDDPWKVLDTEFTLEVILPDGSIYRCKLDMLIENQYGLWIVDHKTHRVLPDNDYRLLDAQSALYIWAALKNNIPVQGHIWNYMRSKCPSTPALLQSGARLSRAKIDTDYPTYRKALKAYGLDPEHYWEKLKNLKSQRFVPGELQTSPFFRRDTLEKSPAMIRRVASEAYQTHLRMHSYHWDRVDLIERNTGTHCKFACSYLDVCTADLFTGNSEFIKRQKYKVGDPLDYYYDERPADQERT
jgi:PD-(D/E)XK nuclease superfamily